MLELRNVARTAGSEVCVAETTLALERGSVNVLLGPTGSGKTSLLRLMAGLDRPTAGSIWFDGADVTGRPVRQRNVAMVYQQFVNYPTLSVYENIASPLRVAAVAAAEIDRRVLETAERLKLGPYLQRKPAELSGGQQQRTALARAIVKAAPLVLLDEPLANLDYKLREELREELPRLFADTGSILVYATTEPAEALLLGGATATLSQGRITQFGPTLAVFREPGDLITAQTFSDPPLNTIAVAKRGARFVAEGFASPAPAMADGDYILGLRPHHLRLDADGPALHGVVRVCEITGSETYVHLQIAGRDWVLLAGGVRSLQPGAAVQVSFDPAQLMVFHADGQAASARKAAA
ncbi:ABC transporter ATP-binding protein [Phenylobacterium sp.]|uniref:ABC transporter ATP-binding protein n=1 Tax=Phenylobacterium sp. TaxID=1871053 RepID=UPI0035656280